MFFPPGQRKMSDESRLSSSTVSEAEYRMYMKCIRTHACLLKLTFIHISKICLLLQPPFHSNDHVNVQTCPFEPFEPALWVKALKHLREIIYNLHLFFRAILWVIFNTVLSSKVGGKITAHSVFSTQDVLSPTSSSSFSGKKYEIKKYKKKGAGCKKYDTKSWCLSPE